MNNRILVIGGLGFIGSEIVNLLCSLNYEVYVYDNYSIGSIERLSEQSQKQAVVIKGDVRDYELLRTQLAYIQPQAVINMAALHYIPYCVEHPEETFDVNVTGTKNIVRALKDLPITPRFIMASSAAVYGSPSVSPQNESTTLQAVDIYGESKKRCEEIIKRELSDFIILRLFNTFGPRDPHPHLIPSIIKQLFNDTVTLGNPFSARDYVYVTDVARAFVKAVQAQKTAEVYNVGTGSSKTVKEVSGAISETAANSPMFLYNYEAKLRKNDPVLLRADTTKIADDLAWKPTISFEEGIEEIIRLEQPAVH